MTQMVPEELSRHLTLNARTLNSCGKTKLEVTNYMTPQGHQPHERVAFHEDSWDKGDMTLEYVGTHRKGQRGQGKGQGKSSGKGVGTNRGHGKSDMKGGLKGSCYWCLEVGHKASECAKKRE